MANQQQTMHIIRSIYHLIDRIHFRLEAAAVQLWINANKELLEKEISDLSGDAFNKQCTSLFKKLGKEEKKVCVYFNSLL